MRSFKFVMYWHLLCICCSYTANHRKMDRMVRPYQTAETWFVHQLLQPSLLLSENNMILNSLTLSLFAPTLSLWAISTIHQFLAMLQIKSLELPYENTAMEEIQIPFCIAVICPNKVVRYDNKHPQRIHLRNILFRSALYLTWDPV